MKNITLKDLKEALEYSWSKETSADPDKWTSENPAWGQCAVSALIGEDCFGGNLLRYDLLGMGSHYINQLPNGDEVDLTASQFPKNLYECIKNHSPKEPRTREYVLSYPETKKRYKLLKQRVEEYLRNKGEA